jgi:fumarate reductase iron-sulfur subunit
MKPDFLGAVGLNQLARFKIVPRDQRTDSDYYEVVGDETGIFGCMNLLACEDNFPKDLPLVQQLAYIRRSMVKVALA